MPDFAYKARDSMGQSVRGAMTAQDEAELVQFLKKEKGLYLISCREQRAKKAITTGPAPRSWRGIRRKDLMTFTYNVSALHAGGIPLSDALQEAARRSENSKMRLVIEGLHNKIQEGSLVSDAMGQYPSVFPFAYVSIVRVGETTGRLAEVLDMLLKNMEWAEEVSSDVKQATSYPAIVLVLVLAIFALLMIFVAPRMREMLSTLKVPLPWITQVTLGVGTFVADYWYVVLGLVAGVVLAYRAVNATPRGRFAVDWIKLLLPLTGDLTGKLAFSSFAHYLSVMHKAGIDIIQALEIVEKIISNRVIAEGIRETREGVTQGLTLTKALAACPRFPPIVLQMVAIGETTGRLDEALDKVCQYYDRETKTTIKRMLAIIQPLLIVGLAGGILVMALSLYLPFFKMISGIKGVQ